MTATRTFSAFDESLSVVRAGRGSVRFFDVCIDNIDGKTALDYVEAFVRERRGKAKSVVFANVHTIHLARKDVSFKTAVNTADLVLPDGSGLAIAGRLFANPIRENLNGTDFTPKVLAMAEEFGWSVYLFGSQQKIVTTCERRIQRQFPRLKIAGATGGFIRKEEEQNLINEINERKPDILLVGLGSPRQELWIAKNKRLLDVSICMAVGGLFDFLAERFPRAPQWMRRLGIEWIYRFLLDPKTKWDRVFIEIPKFLCLVVLNAPLARYRTRTPSIKHS
ncbi:MAG TPA: WecB/TagA/CpsF family glycosyltransferase [Bacteroidota bacterium]|nr:WecB/TagA/CpsF family glycosyltransferase [Bacteroidota bacterium]